MDLVGSRQTKRNVTLSEERRALLERMLSATGLRAAGEEAPARVPRRDSSGPAPLSNAQQRLWFLHQLAPNSAFYNVPIATRLEDRVDASVLGRAIDELVRRHEILRTAFPLIDGTPVQIVYPEAHVPLRVVIATGRAEAQRLADEEASLPFDLARGPMIRALLARLGEAEFWLVLTLHHIVCDGWSMNVLARELRTLYTAFAAGRPSPLPELPIQYADFAVWQREWLRGERLEAQLAYWRTQLAGLPPVPLIADRPRAAAPDFRGGFHRFTLPDGVSAGLRQLAASENATLFMVLLAAFNILLFRYTGQDDIVVGAPIANRTHKDLEPLIGFFVNTLVLRTDLSGSPSVRAAIDRVRRVALDAYAHQDVPFERLVEVLQPERDLSRNPLFQIGFALQNAWDADSGPEQDHQPNVQRGTAIFDLAIHLWESGDSIRCGIEYSAALFDGSTIARLSEHFLTLLESVVLDPDADIEELSLLSPSERHRVTVAWNQTEAPYADCASFHQLVEAHAIATPEAVALKGARESVTYRELNERADAVAWRLRALGARKGSLVLTCLERSVELAVNFLGILKAGGVYVPLDPSYPGERLRFTANDTGARIAITSRALLHGAAGAALAGTGLEFVCIEDVPCGGETGNSSAECGLEDLAYVIYTSGSTGWPKGVLIEHRGLCNVAVAQQRALGAGPDSRVLQFASPAFDASIFEMALALGSGGMLCIPPPELLPGPELNDYLRREQVSIVTLTPTALAAMPDEPLPALRTVNAAGEACPAALVSRWARGRRFFNLYGPTEASIWSTYAECTHQGGKPPIGRPIQNVRAYILDAHGGPVPIGVPGEIWLGGVGLAREYLNRPELTAERFQTIVIGGVPQRLYRTGDRGRLLADGNIDFLGRADSQVKIRGHRIELGEVEEALRSHPGLSDTVVIVREDHPGDRRLVGYVTAAHDLAADARTARELAMEQVSHWRRIYDGLYSETDGTPDPTFNIRGWNSSYTGVPIPAHEMREWLDATVARLRTLDPKHVLEIGCGAGPLLFRLASSCATYTGTDFSPAALHHIRRHLPAELSADGRVRLLVRDADDFADIPAGQHDVIIFNSVVQYFPSADYLRRSLADAVRAAAPGGAIFIGDVRSLALLETFALSVELAHAHDDVKVAGMRDRVARRLLLEQELVAAPEFFYALRADLPAIRRIEVLAKPGRYVNELSAYRYDVILHLGDGPAESAPRVHLAWPADVSTTGALRKRIEQSGGADIHVTGVPNGRLQRDIRAKTVLAALDENDTVADLHARLGEDVRSVDPAELTALAEALGREVELYAAAAGDAGSFDAFFRRKGAAALRRPPVGSSRWEAGRSSSHYTNNPLRGVFLRAMVPRIRTFLEARLPEPFVPAQYVLLDRLPRTSSGKVDRARLPAPDRARPDLGIEYVAPASDVERVLTDIWREVLGVSRVGVLDNFFELGGDSILGIQIVAKARRAGLELNPQHLFEHQTIEVLARVSTSRGSIESEQGTVTGPVPLTPVQRWFFEQDLAERHHFNQAVMMRLAQPLAFEPLRESVRHLLRHHDALRLRFRQSESGWEQTCEPPDDEVPASFVDLRDIPAAGLTSALERAVSEAHTSLDLERGPLARVLLIECGDGTPGRLLVVAHHLVMDAVSWHILMEDLQTAYAQISSNQTPMLPAKTTSFKRWAGLLRQYAASEMLQGEMPYWRAIAARQFSGLPLDYGGGNTVGSMRTVTAALEPEATSALLMKLADGKHGYMEEVLLAALARAAAGIADEGDLLVDVERHGREELFPSADLTRTAGWFTSIAPICLALSRSAGAEETLGSVREELRAMPTRGLGFGLLRYLSGGDEIAEALEPLTRATIAFNYLGQLGRMPLAAPDALIREGGLARGARNLRRHLLEVNGFVTNGQFLADFHYSQNLHARATIERLADGFAAALREFAALAQAKPRKRTASDFKQARLSQRDFTKLMAKLASQGCQEQ